MVRRLKADHFGERFPARVIEPIRLAGLPQDAPSWSCPECSQPMGRPSEPARWASTRSRECAPGYRRPPAAAALLHSRLRPHPGGIFAAFSALAGGASVVAAQAFVQEQPRPRMNPWRRPPEQQLSMRREEPGRGGGAAMLAARLGHRPSRGDARPGKGECPPPGCECKHAGWRIGSEPTLRPAVAGTTDARSSSPNTRMPAAGCRSASPRRSTTSTPTRASQPHRRHADRPPRGAQASVQCRPGSGPAAHPDLHGCGNARASTSSPAATTSSTSTCRNPARLEQRNGRIDRKLQPPPTVWCRYFLLNSARRTSSSRRSSGRPERPRGWVRWAKSSPTSSTDRLEREGIVCPAAPPARWPALATTSWSSYCSSPRWTTRPPPAARQAKELDDLREPWSARASGSASIRRKCVTSSAPALGRVGSALDAAQAGEVSARRCSYLDAAHPALQSAGWPGSARRPSHPRRGRNEKLKDWRATAPPGRRLLPPRRDGGGRRRGRRPALTEHRLVRRLLALPEPGLPGRPLPGPAS